MSGHDFDLRAWARNPVNLLSTLMIWGGLIVAAGTQTPWVMWIFGAGLFGPTLLRELGVLRWEEEYQREVVVRAALHAVLAVGLMLVAIMAINGFGGRYNAEMKVFDDAVPASTVMTLLAIVWYLSRLLQYWGPRKAAFRIWGGVGLVWSAVVVVAIVAIPEMRSDYSLRKLGEQFVPAVPLLLLAALSARRPRPAGVLGLALVIWMLSVSGMRQWFSADIPWETSLDVLLLVLAPIAAPVIPLLASRKL